jgi:two-component system sensor histidine kinase TctE
MLAPLLLWPMSIAVTYLVAKSIANGRSTARWRPTRTCSRSRSTRSTASPSCAAAAARDFLRADNVDSVYYQVLGTRGELAGDATCRCRAKKTGRRRASSCSATTLRGNDVRVAYTTVALPTPGGPQPVLVQVARRSTSATRWPTTSSRA